jgi:hypothetical protein
MSVGISDQGFTLPRHVSSPPLASPSHFEGLPAMNPLSASKSPPWANCGCPRGSFGVGMSG